MFSIVSTINIVVIYVLFLKLELYHIYFTCACDGSALTWNDSSGSMKATGLITPVVRQLVSTNRMSSALAAHTMTVVLQGLQVHGQHDANQGSLLMLGTQLYEILRPKYPQVLEVSVSPILMHNVQ